MISDYELEVLEMESETSMTHRAAAEIRRLRAALAERDAMLGKHLLIESMPNEPRLLSIKLDDMELGPIYVGDSTYHSFHLENIRRLEDLRRAASLASEIKEKQG